MHHDPILLKNVGLSFPQKSCFSGLSTIIHPGQKIALIGRNGCGKSTLLKIIQGLIEPSDGTIILPPTITFGYVPQIIDDYETLSGGQRINKALTQALAINPSVLCLDEPTNNLDIRNRNALMRLLGRYPGTLIIVTHDVSLLRTCINQIWHIAEGAVHLFSGNYDDYIREVGIKRITLEQEIAHLGRQKKDMHEALMKEQARASKSRAKGKKNIDRRKWPTIVSKAKAKHAEETSGQKKTAIDTKKQALYEKLSELRIPEAIVPKFSLTPADCTSRTLISIQNGSIGYAEQETLLAYINLSVRSQDRLAITGDNGSGKSTLLKAILEDPTVIRSGNWQVPKRQYIGYLDQHYRTLDPRKSVLESIQDLVPTWYHADVRRHLNDFLFRKNEEVLAYVTTLSGGEKVRLSLAQIAAQTPKLLILDEVTNNLDLETRDHVIQVLKSYPGAIIVVSHDEDFLVQIRIERTYGIEM